MLLILVFLSRQCSMKPTANKAQPVAAKAQSAARQAVAAAASAQPAAAEGGGGADDGEDLEEMRKRLQALRGWQAYACPARTQLAI